MARRVTRAGIEDRRNYTPPGRLRRIAHDYRGTTVALLLGVLIAAGLFAATSAMAVNARLDRRVAEMVATRDERSMEFMRRREAEITQQVAQRERSLARKEEELAPRDRPYLVVSLAERRVLYLKGDDTLFKAPVAIGSGETMVIDGVTKRFQTPRGKMSITAKELDPVWVPPNWHYVQIARRNGLGIVDMSDAPPNALNGRFPPGQVPISGGKVIIPPWGSPQRAMRGTLGAAKLEMYDGYYFHGTDNPNSVGDAASHGCLRMLRDDILWMYHHIPVGTPVYIY
ncbi:L,D-transpeptidase [Longimicrobium sp.]|uniref:L,D-transpeptidase n=1 Tax=Longimicrobium sp. TaxID=2029185 RepID=UPI002CF03D2A|nr:L,D-transpeptidase [Longimicrobium sp.]HSU14175.1 L,D-transpeptidase [Longimicrobium sp.]